jgi:RNA polymerase sigma-70 factor (ECF subfamily)
MRELMKKPTTIANLVERAKTADQQAIQDLVVHFQPRLEGFVHSRMGHRMQLQTDAEDVVQETLAKAFQNIRQLNWQGEKAFFSWLVSIAENIILSASQKADRIPLELNPDAPDSEESPSKHLRRNERFERLEKAIGCLSPDHRQVVLMARVERLQTAEIAARMNRSPNAVKKLLARALQELKREFGDTESLHLPQRPLNVEGAGDVE